MNDDSLFHALRNSDRLIEVQRERVATAMTADDIHEDIHLFFAKLCADFGAPTVTADRHAAKL